MSEWIYSNLAEWRDLNAARVIREFKNGGDFYNSPIRLVGWRVCTVRA